MGARGLGGGVEAEPVVAASVARGAGGVVCEEALAAAFEGGGREARSVVGHLDDEVAALDVAGDRHARARVLGGVGHEVRGGSRQAGSVERGLGRARDSGARCVSSRGFEQKEHRKLSSLSIGSAHAF